MKQLELSLHLFVHSNFTCIPLYDAKVHYMLPRTSGSKCGQTRTYTDKHNSNMITISIFIAVLAFWFSRQEQWHMLNCERPSSSSCTWVSKAFANAYANY